MKLHRPLSLSLLACSTTIESTGTAEAASPKAPDKWSTAKSKDSFDVRLNLAREKIAEQDRSRHQGVRSDAGSDAREILKCLLMEATASGNNSRVADVYLALGARDEAIGCITLEDYQQALAFSERAHGPNHPQVAEALNGMATMNAWKGNAAEAADCLNRSAKIMEANQGAGAAQLAKALDDSMKRGLRRAGDSARLVRRIQRSIEKYVKPDDPALAQVLHALSLTSEPRSAFGQRPDAPADAAEEALKKAIAIEVKSVGPQSLRVTDIVSLPQIGPFERRKRAGYKCMTADDIFSWRRSNR